MGTTVTDNGELFLIEQAMIEFFRADGIEEIDWATGDYETHGRYLIAMWLGMSKEEAHEWTYNE